MRVEPTMRSTLTSVVRRRALLHENGTLKLYLFGIIALMFLAGPASAQSTSPDEFPKIEIFAGHSALGENQKPISFKGIIVPHGYAAEAGVEASLIRNFNRYLGLKADFSAHFNDETGPGNVIICNPACATASQIINFAHAFTTFSRARN